LLDVDTFEDELPDAARWVLDDARHAGLQATARESVADKTWAALGDQLLGYYEEVLGAYERNVVRIFGRDMDLPRWAPA
ncbi:alpha-mannosyltransferase, partial [Mycobacterium tuberculosis]|nr:alpha-mannosyltransferase [Mycobacterium tuberculosis]